MPGDGSGSVPGSAPGRVAAPGRARGQVALGAGTAGARRAAPHRARPARPPAQRPEPQRSATASRLVPAGKVLGVGLVCFAVWLMLDARQLYNEALSSPIGVRRSVAISIMRPLARLSEALSLDRPVNAANRSLGRCAGAGAGGAGGAGGGAIGASGQSFACGPGPGGGGPGAGGGGAGAGGAGGTAAGRGASGRGGAPSVLPSTPSTSTTLPGPTPTTRGQAGSQGSASHPSTSSPGSSTSTAGSTTVAPASSTVLVSSTTAPGSAAGGGPTTSSGAGAGAVGTTTAPSTTTRPAGALAPLAQPSAAHPISIVQIGDSLGEDLGFGLQSTIGADPAVVLKTVAVGDTGLADPAYYNWPVALARDLAAYHPAIVIAMFGGNDCQSFYEGTGSTAVLEQPGTAGFDGAYSARVAVIMSEALAAGARVFWVGMPIMQDPGFSSCMQELNRDYAAEAASHPGVTFFPTWKLFEDAHGQYAEYLDVGGSLAQVRVDDGVHINGPAGTALVGSAVVSAMDATYHIKL